MLIPDRDEIAISDHARLLGTDPVGDETSMIPGFHVVRALVAKQVMSRKLAGQMEIILRHHQAFLRPILSANAGRRDGLPGTIGNPRDIFVISVSNQGFAPFKAITWRRVRLPSFAGQIIISMAGVKELMNESARKKQFVERIQQIYPTGKSPKNSVNPLAKIF